MTDRWEMDFDHNTFTPELNCEVELPCLRDGGQFMKEVIYGVLTYGFAIGYSEGSHSLQVKQRDWELINGLVKEMDNDRKKKIEDKEFFENLKNKRTIRRR